MPLYPLLAPHAELGKVTTLNTLRTLSSLEASDMSCSAWRPGAERHSSSTALHILIISFIFQKVIGSQKSRPGKSNRHIGLIPFLSVPPTDLLDIG